MFKRNLITIIYLCFLGVFFFNWFEFDFHGSMDIKYHFNVLFVYGVALMLYTVLMIKKSALSKILIIAIGMVYVIGTMKMVFLMNFLESYESSNLTIKMVYELLIMYSFSTWIILFLEKIQPTGNLLTIDFEQRNQERRMVIGILLLTVIASLVSLYYFASLGIPYVNVDHFSFRSAMGANLILSTIARWLAYITSFSILMLLVFKRNKILMLSIIIGVVVMFMWGSRTMLGCSVGASIISFVMIYSRRIGAKSKGKITRMYIIAGCVLMFFLIGIELIRTRSDWQGKSTEEMGYFLAINLGLYNQLVIADNVISRNDKIGDYYSSDSYLETVVKGLIPGSLLNIAGVEKTELTGDLYNNVLDTDNPLGISIGHVNEMYLKNSNLIIPASTFFIILFFLFKSDRYIRRIKVLTPSNLLNLHLCCVTLFCAVIFNFNSSGSGLYYFVYLYLPPYLFLKFMLRLKV